MRFRNFLVATAFVILFTAASAHAQFDIFGTVNGQIQSAGGRGVGRAQVTITNLTTLESSIRVTNDFGYFHFEQLPFFDLYIVSVRSKRHQFLTSSQVVQFSATEHFALFVATD